MPPCSTEPDQKSDASRTGDGYGDLRSGAQVAAPSPVKRATRVRIPPPVTAGVVQRPRTLMLPLPTLISERPRREPSITGQPDGRLAHAAWRWCARQPRHVTPWRPTGALCLAPGRPGRPRGAVRCRTCPSRSRYAPRQRARRGDSCRAAAHGVRIRHAPRCRRKDPGSRAEVQLVRPQLPKRVRAYLAPEESRGTWRDGSGTLWFGPDNLRRDRSDDS